MLTDISRISASSTLAGFLPIQSDISPNRVQSTLDLIIKQMKPYQPDHHQTIKPPPHTCECEGGRGWGVIKWEASHIRGHQRLERSCQPVTQQLHKLHFDLDIGYFIAAVSVPTLYRFTLPAKNELQFTFAVMYLAHTTQRDAQSRLQTATEHC